MENKIVVVHFINQLQIGGAEEVLRVQHKYINNPNIVQYTLTMSENIIGDEIRQLGGNVIVGTMEDNINFCGLLQPDIILFHSAGYIPFESNPVQELCPKAKKCIVIHSPQTLKNKPDFIDLLICVSKTVYDMQIYREKIVIENGIDIEKINKRSVTTEELKEYNIIPTEIVIGRLSRIAPDKLTTDFLLAAQRIANKIGNIKFMIVGESNENLHPGYLYDMRKLAYSLGLSDKVIWTGVQRDLTKYLSMMDICLNPTSQESFGMVFSESMAAYLPVVTYDDCANKETVKNDFNGYTVPFRNVEKLAEKTVELCLNKTKRLEFGKNARMFVESDKSGLVMAQKYNELFNFLTKGN
jgi:glycosyltransferase involved in cell wall biosynthesis